MIVGHPLPTAAFLEGWREDRLHHAWLLAGPEGIGKRAFADAAALMVLAGARSFDESAGSQAANLIAAGSHPDYMAIEREPLQAGRIAKEIVIHQVRGNPSDTIRRSHVVDSKKYVARLFESKPSIAEWRVVIIDAIDDMNVQTANALLKTLEEPPARALFLLVSHSPGRLLPTIRSRARRLVFRPLGHAETRAVIAVHAPDLDEDELDALADLAEGAPGRALRYAGLQVGKLATDLDALALAAPAQARARALALGRALAGKAAQPRYEAFLDLAPRRLAAAARRATGPRLARTIALWEEAQGLAASAPGLSLDPAAVVAELATLVAGIDREQP